MTDELSKQLDEIAADFETGVAQVQQNLAENVQAPALDTSVRSAGAPATPSTAAQMLAALSAQQQIGSLPAFSLLAEGSVTGNLIGDNEITSDQIAALAILAEHLADNSVLQDALADSAVSTEKIAAGAVTAAKIAAGEIWAYHISAAGILASQITSGTLSVGGLDNVPESILVYNQAGELVCVFDENGILITDPQDSSKVIWITDGFIKFSKDGGVNWGTAINALGVVADSILVGTAPGGVNAIPNSSFEVRPFANDQQTNWEDDIGWESPATAIATSVNMNTAGTSLALSSVAYV